MFIFKNAFEIFVFDLEQILSENEKANKKLIVVISFLKCLKINTLKVKVIPQLKKYLQG